MEIIMLPLDVKPPLSLDLIDSPVLVEHFKAIYVQDTDHSGGGLLW